MAVTVILGRYPSGAVSGVETYKDGASIAVKESGHLVVNAASQGMVTPILAIYAPGKWVTAHKDDARQFESAE